MNDYPAALLERIAEVIDPAPFEPIGRSKKERYFRDGAGAYRKKEAMKKAQIILRIIEAARRGAMPGPIGKRSELVARLAVELGQWSLDSARTREGAERCLRLIDQAGLEIRRKPTLNRERPR